MFAKDSERGRIGGPSWGSGWNAYGSNNNYGHNPNLEGQEDFRNQGFGGRGYEQEVSRNSSDTVCQNYLRNKCSRGSSCPFQHPPMSGSSPRPATTLNSKKLQNAWLNFCPDFQRGQCLYSDECRLLHVSKQDEAEYRTSGDIPTGVVEQAMSKAMVMDWAYIGNQPHCKNYLQGSCTLRDCRLRHLNTDQYVVEVLQALREKFEMNSNALFQGPPLEGGLSLSAQKPDQYEAHRGHGMGNVGADQYGDLRAHNRALENQESNQYGMRRAPGLPAGIQEADQYGARRDPVHSRDNFEPETKRMRAQDSSYQLDVRGESRRNNSRGNDSFSRSQSTDESFLEKLRRDNVDLTATNENVKKTARHLEDENTELRKALRLALDLNSYARNLPEFRNQLRDIMSSLRKRGFQPNAQPDAGPWSSMPVKSMNSGRDDWMHGNRFPSDMSNKGSRYSLSEYDRGDMQHVDAGRFKSSW